MIDAMDQGQRDEILSHLGAVAEALGRRAAHIQGKRFTAAQQEADAELLRQWALGVLLPEDPDWVYEALCSLQEKVGIEFEEADE